MYVLSDGADAVVALIQLLGTIFFIVVVVWIIKAGVRGGMKAHVQDRAAERPASTGFASAKSPSPRGIAVAARDPAGKFVIHGVDRETKMDTTWHCVAASEANARVKAELEGIVVTLVAREG